MTTLPTVLLLPGLMCDQAVWETQKQTLSQQFSCVIPDYGMANSIAQMAECALALVPSGPLHVVGHSMGGRVAMEIARQVPERLSKLVLMDTGLDPLAPGEGGESEKRTRLALLKLARAQGMRAMGRQWAGGMVHPDLRHSPLFEQVLDMLERSSPDKFEAQITALLNRPDAGPVFAGLACPILLMAGRQDLWSPVARHQAMAQLNPGAHLVVVENSGHMTTMEQPDFVNQALVQFL